MGIIIEEINANNKNDVNKFDDEFLIDAKFVLYVFDDDILYKGVETPQTKKRYQSDEINSIAYNDNPNKAIYFAYVDEQIAGQIVLPKTGTIMPMSRI